MSVVDNIVTSPCSAPGCSGFTEVRRGRYAGLCPEHRAEIARGIREDGRVKTRAELTAIPAVAEASENGTQLEILEGLARKLVKPARRLDLALGRRRVAKMESKKALEEFGRALTALQEAANRALKA